MKTVPIALWYCLTHRRSRYILSWLLFLGVAAAMSYVAWIARDKPERPDGNDGHATIDFGGQWLMGRMMIEGHGHQLYDRRYHRRVLGEHYAAGDVKNLLYWMMGSSEDEQLDSDEKQVGGPLYPPVHCFVIYPLSLMPPRLAYRISQVLNMLEALLAGWALRRISKQRIWLPLASLLVILFFGFASSLALGQNATLALDILLWGWVFMAEGKPVRGGLFWGLLAFKPVWALSFFFLPLLTRRWRAALAMGLTGASLFVLTLPVVGWQSWLDWLQVGQEAALEYKKDRKWIRLSRDVLGLPRRWFGTLEESPPVRSEIGPAPATRSLPIVRTTVAPWIVDAVGWGMLGGILACTAGLAIVRWREAQATSGAIPAFILLGAWLCCYHFMYYDVLLTVLPLAVLLVDEQTFFVPTLVRIDPRLPITRAVSRLSPETLGPDLSGYYQPRTARRFPQLLQGFRTSLSCIWAVNSLPMTLVFLLYLEYPYNIMFEYVRGRESGGVAWDTYCLIVIWAWCGFRWLKSHPHPLSALACSVTFPCRTAHVGAGR